MVAFHDLKAFSGDFSDELSLLLDTKTALMDPETIWVFRTNQHSEAEWDNCVLLVKPYSIILLQKMSLC